MRSSVRGDALGPQSIGVSRRRFSSILFSSVVLSFLDWPDPGSPLAAAEAPFSAPPDSYPLFGEAVSHVLPPLGYQTRISFRDAVVKLVEYGVVDRSKFFAMYGTNGPHPHEFLRALEPIL